MDTIINDLRLVVFILVALLSLAIYYGWKAAARFIVLWLVEMEILFDAIPEGYATAYESGGKVGKFYALALSYGEFGAVKAPGDLNWAIRRIGEKIGGPEWADENGVVRPEWNKLCTKDDFHWDRRPEFIKKIFGEETGIVYMGPWPGTRPKYYELRIINFRTIRPTDDEIAEKKLDVREYKVGEQGNEQIAGYLVSWNERTKRVLLSDDNYPFPVDGVRIGVNIDSKQDGKQQAQQGLLANILPFLRARICEPRLYLYRVQSALEVIQNDLIQLVRELCACKSLIEVYALRVTLQSDQKGQENVILARNSFGKYIRTRYGFEAKGGSFAFINILGAAGKAISAPYIAQQEATANVIRGKGEGEAEQARLIAEGNALDNLVAKFGLEMALAMRNADVAERFAAGDNKTLLLGFQGLIDGIGHFGNKTTQPLPEKGVGPSEFKQPKP
jgi:hypothetical protein